MRYPAVFLLLGVLLTASQVFAFRPNDFKRCDQSGFCRRGRALSARALAAGDSWRSPYSINPYSVVVAPDQASFTASVKSAIYPTVRFSLDVRLHEDGVVRILMDEVGGLRQRYNEAASWALVEEPRISRNIQWTVRKDSIRAVYGKSKDVEVVIQYEPLKVTLLRAGIEQVVLNDRGLFHMEHFRTKEDSKHPQTSDGEQKVFQANDPTWFEGEEQDAWWEETFASWTDSKPKGPESLSLDVTFPNHRHVYGIPQHATTMSLPSTTGPDAKFSDPFRLYNTDIFQYPASSPLSLYGSVPLMHAHNAKSTVAILNLVASDTWVDIGHSDHTVQTHWTSESGILDFFILPGPTSADVFAQYSRLTGFAPLPPSWSLGYHQSRWNYLTSDDVRNVQKQFDIAEIPCDSIWLDIDYAEDHMYFLWHSGFPDPVDMIKDIEARERRMVIIVDPHHKRTPKNPVYTIASDRGLLVKPSSGSGEYEGWCWSGHSSWIDFFNPRSWDLWTSFFQTKSHEGEWNWIDSTDNVGIWNDMGEPSVFNGPEISMPRDNLHYGGWEHRDVHNINGMLVANQTYKGLLRRSDPPKRPFVLTRPFYAGSQRFGTMWTGDNLGTWEHLDVGVKMMLSSGLGGFGFTGTDVGGFFGDPEMEMLVRWYAVGAFSPFFRSHAHIDSKRREPYLLLEPYKGMIKDFIKLRYTMIPIWYTAFIEMCENGVPIMRPQYMVFPKDEQGFGMDDQYYVGSSGLLVKPITTRGQTSTTVYFSDPEIYYDYFTTYAYPPSKSVSSRTISVTAALHQVPVFIRGGSILPTRERPRRSSLLMRNDPITLRVALGVDGSASGKLYLDEGEGYGYAQGEFVSRAFGAETKKAKMLRIWSKDGAAAGELNAIATYNPSNSFAQNIADVRVERVMVIGVDKRPATVKMVGGEVLQWEWMEGGGHKSTREGKAGVLVIKNPGVRIVSDWELVISF